MERRKFLEVAPYVVGGALGVCSTEASAQTQSTSQYVSVMDFGALGVGTDDTAAINKADASASAAGVALYFPPGVYGINSSGISKGSCSWCGSSARSSILKALPQTFSPLTGVVTGSNLTNVDIQNIGFDISQGVFPAGSGNPGNIYWALSFSLCSNWVVRNCAFTGIQPQTIGLAVDGGSGLMINDNYFACPNPTSAFTQAINVSIAAGSVTNYTVRGNVSTGCGFLSAGAVGIFSKNVVSGYRFGAGIAIGPAVGCIMHVIEGNICIGGVGQDINGTWPSGIESWTPYSTIKGNLCYNNSGHGIAQGGQSTVISGNFCLNNAQSAASGASGITMVSIAGHYCARDCTVSGNISMDNQSTPTQNYGYMEQADAGGDLIINNVIADNNFASNKLGTMLMDSQQYSFRGPQLFGQYSIHPGAVENGAQYTTTFTVYGAALGDTVKLAYATDQAQCIFYGYVISENTIRVVVQNNTGGTQTLGAANLNIWVEKPVAYANLG